jgi:hypothetical protein
MYRKDDSKGMPEVTLIAGSGLQPSDEENPTMYQRFTIWRVIALSLSVTLLTAAPLLCIHPISAQIKKAQRVAMKQQREKGVVLGSRTSPFRLATTPRPGSNQGPWPHNLQRENKEQVAGGKNPFKAPVLVEVTRDAGLPLPESTVNETEVPGMRGAVSPETEQ